MNIKICSLVETIDSLANNQFNNKHIISIWGCDFNKSNDFNVINKLSNKCKSIKFLVMDDIEEQIESEKYNLILPSKEIINAAINWIKPKLNEEIVVHCAGGVSRSAALAFIINCIDNEPEEAMNILDFKFHWPNDLIIRLGAEILNKPSIITIINNTKLIWHERDRKLNETIIL